VRADELPAGIDLGVGLLGNYRQAYKYSEREEQDYEDRFHWNILYIFMHTRYIQ
jgi:hypothetical protein